MRDRPGGTHRVRAGGALSVRGGTVGVCWTGADQSGCAALTADEKQDVSEAVAHGAVAHEAVAKEVMSFEGIETSQARS